MAKGKRKSTKEKLTPVSVDISRAVIPYRNLLDKEMREKDMQALRKCVRHGENFLRQTQRTEVKKFDDSIIPELEAGLNAIESIISNYKTFIKEQPELVNVGLAKKVTNLSIRHFATHSQFVRNINENNEVIPEKVLTIFAETDVAIYENRFVMTLIKRCLSFIQTRYEYIMSHGETKDSDLLLVHNKTTIDNVTYEVDSRIKVSVPSDDDGNTEKNKELLEKLTELKNRCATYFSSTFMTEMKGAKDVSSPIHMTNMIVKNQDYHRCYLFWEFLDSYEELGVSFDIKERNTDFNQEYLNEINTYIANSIALLHTHKIDDRVINTSVNEKITPSVVFTLEDETFEDGKYLYDAYPEAKEKRNDPLPPTSEEVRLREARIKQRIKNQKDAKANIDKEIRKRKDEIVYEEAIARKNRQKDFEAQYYELLAELNSLKEENDKLVTEVELIRAINDKRKKAK